METTLLPRDSQATSVSIEMELKAKSAPIGLILRDQEPSLKPHISAPSYLFSLKENEAPPFKRPGKELRARIVIGTIMDADEAILMVAASGQENGLKQFLGSFLVDKKVLPNYSLSEKSFLLELLKETINLAARHDLNAAKLACLVTIYLDTHIYFKSYYWRSPQQVWEYFKETMIRHAVEDSPDGQEVFEPEECYDIVTHFHTLYLSNLPLVHILTFGCHRIKFLWPFKAK